jgi:opacity protein-like surface antigen
MRILCGVLLAAALVGPARAGVDVNIDWDHAYDFSTVKTFNIRVATTWNNPLGEKRVLEEFQQAFTAKGWTLVTSDDQANAVVLLHGATQQKHSLRTFYSGYGGGYRWGGMGTASTYDYEYTQGTLVVDIYDVKTKDLVWRGVASDELSEKAEKRAKQLAKASDKLLKDFPPKPEKKKG